MQTVLPADMAALQVNGNGLDTGSWQCAVRIRNADGTQETWSGEVTVPAAVAAATKRVAQGDYVAQSGSSIPPWAIALMVLGGLILFSIWALILRRSHDKNLGNPSDT